MPLRNMQVIVHDDAPEDVSIVHAPEGPVLILRSGLWQSQENAVRHLQAHVPEAHPDDVRALVRKHLPDALDFDTLAASTVPDTWVKSDAPPAKTKRRSPWVAKVMMIGAGVAIAAASLVGYHLASTTSAPSGDGPVDMIHSDFFKGFALAAGYKCTALDLDDADCMSLESGKVAVVSARQGDFHRPSTYWFRHADRIAVVYQFESPELAASYANMNSNKRLWPFLSSYGSYAVASIDIGLFMKFETAVKSYQTAVRADALPAGR